MNNELVSQIVSSVLKKLSDDGGSSVGAPLIPVEVSGRHVHFSPAHFEELFGKGAAMENVRDISQPGQFLSANRVKLIGPKGAIDRVAVLGPLRKTTQVEISLTDAAVLGIDPPVRHSGNTENSSGIHIQANGKILFVETCTIVAARHLHMAPRDAALYGVSNGQTVDVYVYGSKPLILCDVLVRADDSGALGLHIDFDEANAAGVKNGGFCRILTERSAPPQEVISVSAISSELPAISSPNEYTLEAVKGTTLLTEKKVEQLYISGIRTIRVRGRLIVTGLAKDALNKRGIVIKKI